MTTRRSPLGRCPECGAEIPRTNLLIEYETTDGGRSRYAACPECEEVVHPRVTDGGGRTVAGS